MIKELIEYLKAWISGEETELHIDKTWTFRWWEVAAIIVIVGLVIYLIWK